MLIIGLSCLKYNEKGRFGAITSKATNFLTRRVVGAVERAELIPRWGAYITPKSSNLLPAAIGRLRVSD